ECMHDSPHCSQKSYIGADGAGRSQKVQVGFKAVHFALVGSAHGSARSIKHGFTVSCRIAPGLEEFGHAGVEDSSKRPVLITPAGNRLLQYGEVAAGPEIIFETSGLRVSPLQGGSLGENIRP